MDNKHELLFAVIRSVRYHTRRRQFFDKYSKIIKFIAVITGTATFAAVSAAWGKWWTLGFAMTVAVSSTIDLIIGTSEKARLHADLAKQFIALEKDMEQAGEEVGQQQLAEFTGRRLSIEMEEPPVKRILDVVCHNEVLRAMGYDEDKDEGKWYKKIHWYQRWFANFVDIRSHSIK